MLIKNLAGIFSGESFRKNNGRNPTFIKSDFILGPIDLEIDESGTISKIEKNIKFENSRVLDGSGLIATSSFYDSHTHSLFSGDRSVEFFQRWRGDSYQSIAQQGGGIHNTMKATSEASDETLINEVLQRLVTSSNKGITHLEIKTGYAVDAPGELRLLRVLKKIRALELPVEIFPTFLGLHALPKDRIESQFVDEMISILPQIKREGLATFVDAFPEKGFFSLEESLRFAKAGMNAGLIPKIHADELSPLGSAETFSKLGARSVDHLQNISAAGLHELANSSCVATLLPATSFFLGLEYAPARKLLMANARVALSTDFNPGTAPDPSPQFTMRLAATAFKMTAAEIFCAFTYNGAAALGIDENCGTVEKNKEANICLWKAPLTSILENISTSALEPKMVFIKGSAPFLQS